MKSDEIPFKDFQKIVDALLSTARVHSDLLFLRIRSKEEVVAYTYWEVLDRVRKIGNYLKRKGFNPGERAAVAGGNCPEWVCSYLGILWVGGVVVPLDSRATSTEWAHLMRHSGCKFLFVSPEFYEEMAELKGTMPVLEEIVCFRGKDPMANLSSIFKTLEGLLEPEERLRDDLAVILYTSGTTGISKGVMLTHGNLLANIEQCITTLLDISEDDRFLSVLPIHHSFESTCGFLLPMAAGASVTFARSLKSGDLLEDLKDTRPTGFLVVPLLLEKLYQGFRRNLRKASPLRKGIFYGLKTLARTCDPLLGRGASKILFRRVRATMGLDRVRCLVSGGAALPRSLSKEYENLGFPILQGYGLTETAPVLSVNLPGKCKNESTGLLLPGIEVKIVNPDPEGVGEIAVKGPNIMRGYYKNEEATRKVLQDGWFYTGDLGKIDEDGFLYVTGRKKSLIVTRGGKNINPEEIEEELLKSPFIKEVIVLARIHPRTKNEEVHAIIYPDFEILDEYSLEKGMTKDKKTIRKLIEEHVEKTNTVLAGYKRIRNFSIREDEFPKTTTQKIKRYLFENRGELCYGGSGTGTETGSGERGVDSEPGRLDGSGGTPEKERAV